MKKQIICLLLFLVCLTAKTQNTNDPLSDMIMPKVKLLNAQCPVKTDEITTMQNVVLIGTAITFKTIVEENYIENISTVNFKKQMINNIITALPQPTEFFKLLDKHGYYLRYLVYSTTGDLFYNITVKPIDILAQIGDDNKNNSSNYISWAKYKIGTFCNFSLPNTLELKNKEIVGQSQYNVKYAEYPNGKYTFQPKGTNDRNANALSKYARIIIVIEKQNDFNQLMIANATQSDINDLNLLFKNEASSLFGNSSDFKWYSTSIKKCGNKYAVITKYQRPSAGGSKPVYVEEYKYFLTGKLVTITSSFRVCESNYWKQDFLKFISTLYFN